MHILRNLKKGSGSRKTLLKYSRWFKARVRSIFNIAFLLQFGGFTEFVYSNLSGSVEGEWLTIRPDSKNPRDLATAHSMRIWTKNLYYRYLLKHK